MALHRKSNGTRITSSTIESVATTVTESDPLVTIDYDLVQRREFPNANGSSKPADSADDFQTLAFRAGQKVRRSKLLAMMTAATVAAITKADGSAATGTTAGGTACAVTGTGLAEVTGITVGGTAATAVTVVDDTRVTFTTPAGTAGAKTVVVTDDSGAVTVPNGFTYA
jgi:hypothetical protein